MLGDSFCKLLCSSLEGGRQATFNPHAWGLFLQVRLGVRLYLSLRVLSIPMLGDSFCKPPQREDNAHRAYLLSIPMLGDSFCKEPAVKLYLVRNEREKLRKLEELVRYPLKTIIFCDWIELGRKISRRLGVPFVHGATKERKKILEENPVVVVSRVGDEGVSVRDLERVIEVAFLYGSRMQEAQRFGRLLHSSRETEHIIIMTHEEYDKYGKRLHSIIEKGFKIQLL